MVPQVHIGFFFSQPILIVQKQIASRELTYINLLFIGFCDEYSPGEQINFVQSRRGKSEKKFKKTFKINNKDFFKQWLEIKTTISQMKIIDVFVVFSISKTTYITVTLP